MWLRSPAPIAIAFNELHFFQQTSLQRRDRPVRERHVPQVGMHRVVEVPVSSSNHGAQGNNFWEEPYAASTLPLKVKPKPTVYSSGHYVSKGQQDRSGPTREVPGVCTQQIKPDSMCYSPAHYDRENEIAARMQNLNIGTSTPKPSEDRTTVITVGEKIPENRHSRPPTVTRRFSSSIYISPSNQSNSSHQSNQSNSPQQSNPSNSRTQVSTGSYDPTVYRSSETRNPPTLTPIITRPKVYYAGNSALSSHSSARDRSPSPARSVDGHGMRPPNYVPAPPYNAMHQREHLKSFSTSSLSKPSYPRSLDDFFTSNSRDARQAPARIITDRAVCERCRGVPIERRQRLCAGCQDELYERHSTTAAFY